MAIPKKKIPSVKELIGEIKFSGVFDYDKFYRGIHRWFKERLYDFHETTYKHKATARGPEVEISFKGERKQSEWIMYRVNVELHIWDLADVEVAKDGKKQKLNKCRMTVVINMEVVFDYEKRFEEKPLYIQLYNFLIDKVLWMKLMLGPVDTLYYEAYTLHTEIKKILNMETAYSAF
jgi:hypothetical protein